jgi:peptidoglycan/xylan/chitin deacetylase (PgdA/CDA1 family)
MLIFDDNRASVSSAYEEMRIREMPGAIAVIPDLVGEDGHLDEAQLRAYHADGWDMVSHPQLEKPLPAYSRARQERELIRAKRWLVANGFPEGADHFVAPYGQVGPNTLEILKKYHHTNYLSSNSLSGTPPTDPLTIERVGIDNVAYAKRQIDRAATYNMVAVLSAHTVGNPDDQWISQEGFVEVLNYIRATDIDVTTPTRYWDAIKRSPSN